MKPRLRHDDQVPTRTTSVLRIMAQPTFMLGVADARAGRGFHGDYDLWDTNRMWCYERGRAWGTVAPRNVPLRIGGEINVAALPFYQCGVI